MTMAKRGEKSVPIKGLTDKRNIVLTFAVTFTGDFLPMQITYGGKKDRSQPRGVVFPKGFHVTQNEKHWSNETETVNFIEQAINPYVTDKRKELELPADQKALLTSMIHDDYPSSMMTMNLIIMCFLTDQIL